MTGRAVEPKVLVRGVSCIGPQLVDGMPQSLPRAARHKDRRIAHDRPLSARDIACLKGTADGVIDAALFSTRQILLLGPRVPIPPMAVSSTNHQTAPHQLPELIATADIDSELQPNPWATKREIDGFEVGTDRLDERRRRREKLTVLRVRDRYGVSLLPERVHSVLEEPMGHDDWMRARR